MSIAVIQMVSQDDVTANLAAARRLLEQAADPVVVEFCRSRPQVVDSRWNAAAAAGWATRGEGECLFAAD